MTLTAEAAAPAATALDALYQNWSGFILTRDGASAPALTLDPSPDVPLGDGPYVIAITHGHPEHVRGTKFHLQRADREPVTVLASRHVCRHLQKRSARPDDDRFIPVDAGDEVDEHGWSVRVFAWTHMTLLPPGGVGVAVRHLAKLFLHPFRLAGVGFQSLGGPKHAPMLGFHVRWGGGTPEGNGNGSAGGSLVYFGEGLHRMTTAEELADAFGDGPVDLLLTGVEPEDTEQIPDLLASRAIGRVVLFEPHRIWREQFGMPQIDLPDLVTRLRDGGHTVDTPAPGDHLRITPGR